MDGHHIELLKLKVKHKTTFLKESQILSQKILDCLLSLEKNPQNIEMKSKLLQSANVLVGTSKFLGDKNLENNAKQILNIFNQKMDKKDKQKQVDFLVDYFQNLDFIFSISKSER